MLQPVMELNPLVEIYHQVKSENLYIVDILFGDQYYPLIKKVLIFTLAQIFI